MCNLNPEIYQRKCLQMSESIKDKGEILNTFTIGKKTDYFEYKKEFDAMWSVIEILINEFKAEYGLNNKNLRFVKFRTKKLYRKYRTLFLKSYMMFNTVRIDKHKIASCMMKSLYIVKPLKLTFKDWFLVRFKPKSINKNNEYKHTVEEMLLANECLVLSVATSIVESYIVAHYNNNDIVQPLKHRIYFPEPFPEGDNNYLRDVCLALYYNNPRKIDIVTYANIFFLWEKYSCRWVQCENLLEAYKDILLYPDKYKEFIGERYKKDDFVYKTEKEINEHIYKIRFCERND